MDVVVAVAAPNSPFVNVVVPIQENVLQWYRYPAFAHVTDRLTVRGVDACGADSGFRRSG
jgi:hypothetical protein